MLIRRAPAAGRAAPGRVRLPPHAMLPGMSRGRFRETTTETSSQDANREACLLTHTFRYLCV